MIRNSTAEFLIFTAQTGGESIEVCYEDETIWLTQKLMATLFDVDVRTVSEHLGNIYEQGELDREATIRKFQTVQTEGSRQVRRDLDHYNLDAVISVGKRFHHEGGATVVPSGINEDELHNFVGRTLAFAGGC